MKVVVEIDALVLDGVAPAHRFAIRDAVVRELSRLLREGLTARAVPERDAGAPVCLGAQIARSVYGRISREPRLVAALGGGAGSAPSRASVAERGPGHAGSPIDT